MSSPDEWEGATIANKTCGISRVCRFIGLKDSKLNKLLTTRMKDNGLRKNLLRPKCKHDKMIRIDTLRTMCSWSVINVAKRTLSSSVGNFWYYSLYKRIVK